VHRRRSGERTIAFTEAYPANLGGARGRRLGGRHRKEAKAHRLAPCERLGPTSADRPLPSAPLHSEVTVRQWIGSHLKFANVVSLAALFVALGGTATAVTYVVSSNSEVGPDTISGHRPPSGDHSNVILGSINGRDVANDKLTGADVDESTLDQVPSAKLGGLGSRPGNNFPCDPESTTFTGPCASAEVTLPAPSRVLVIGEIRAEPDVGNGNGGGSCKVSGMPSPAPVFVNGGQTDVMTISGISDVLGPGTYSFGIVCNETASGIRYFDGNVSAVALSPGG